MDPVATLQWFDEAVEGGEPNGIIEYGNDLVRWLDKGGFMPVGPHTADWRGSLTSNQFASMIRLVVHAVTTVCDAGDVDVIN